MTTIEHGEVAPKEAQALARHSILDLTMNVYGRVRDCLAELKIPFDECGINMIDVAVEPLVIRTHNMLRKGTWSKPIGAVENSLIAQPRRGRPDH